ncbi:MAG: flagellar type III secretion system pore protein FliP [Alphaproteobacteria bacterium]|nr:flagellar type III secretion system pore protein FliP [Alphaproteobacteria bacterium]
MPFIGMLALALLCFSLPAFAQSVTIDAGGSNSSSRIVQIMLLVTVLSLAPSILIMVTSFTRIIVVLGFLRSAMGTQTSPPNIVLISLALFMTMFVMQPVLEKAWADGVQPYMNSKMEEKEAFEKTVAPFHGFMLRHTRTKDLQLFIDLGKITPPKEAKETPLRALIPAFMISELRRAFEIGFLLFLPFLIIDMVIASILMSMGMMMLPPTQISLPFKIIFFVLVDGWYLVAGSLIQSYGAP